MRVIFEIMRKELLRWSRLPAFYTLFAILLLGISLYTWFFRDLSLNVERIVPTVFQAMFWELAITLPFLSTGVILEERKNKTLKTLLSRPITLQQVVLGKMVAIAFVIFTFFCVTAIYYISISQLLEISIRYLLFVYLFLFLVGLAYAIISMTIAAFFNTYWKSYLWAYLAVFIVHSFATFLGEMSVGEIQNFFFYLGIQSHFDYFLEGGFALSSIVYLLSIIIIGFFTTVYKLSRENL